MSSFSSKTSVAHNGSDTASSHAHNLNHDCSQGACCLVCMSPPCQPSGLLCGHTFCGVCLQHYNRTYWNTQPPVDHEVDDLRTLYCPTCHEPSVTTPIAEAINGFGDSFSNKSISISVNGNGKTYEPEPQTCDPCEAQGLHMEAEFYCSKCTLDFCRPCKDLHDQQTIFKSHSTIHYSNKDSINWFCTKPNHRKQPCHYFCDLCSTAACCVCVLTEHSTHNSSKLNETISQRRDNLKILLDSVGPRIERLSTRLKKLQQLTNGSSRPAPRFSNTSAFSTQSSSAASQHTEAIEMETFSEAESHEHQQHVESEIHMWYEEVSKLHQLLDKALRIAEIPQSRKLLSAYDDYKKRLTSVNGMELRVLNDDLIDRLEAELRGGSDGCSSHPVSPGHSTGSIPAAASSSHHSTSHNSTPVHSSTSREDNSVEGSDQFMLLKPKLLWKLEKTRQDLGELWNPSGIAFRPHNGVVVAEYDIMNEKNNRLRLFDEAGHTEGTLAQGLIKPLGVACNRDGNIAVTDCNIKRVKIFQKDGTMVQEIGKSQFGWPYGVACNSHGQYIITDPFHDTIHIFSHDGRKVRTFGTSGSANDQFKNPFHITTDDKDHIYVSDSGNNCIKVFDPSGSFIFMSHDSGRGLVGGRVHELTRHGKHHKGHKSGRLKGPRGVALDMKRNIIVADDCGRVCLFDSYGKYVRNLLMEEDTVKFPEALASNSAGLLALTEWNPNNMFAVKVFSMYV